MILSLKKWMRPEPPSAASQDLASVQDGGIEVEAELSKYLAQIGRMSQQLRETSAQIEDSVVGVCSSFQGIAVRARETVDNATGFLSREGDGTSDKTSFEGLIAIPAIILFMAAMFSAVNSAIGCST